MWAFFIRALVTVTLQPINYLLYLDYSAKGRIIIYNRHFKGAKVYTFSFWASGVILGCLVVIHTYIHSIWILKRPYVL